MNQQPAGKVVCAAEVRPTSEEQNSLLRILFASTPRTWHTFAEHLIFISSESASWAVPTGHKLMTEEKKKKKECRNHGTYVTNVKFNLIEREMLLISSEAP